VPAKEAPGGNFVLSDPAIAWLIEVITAGAYDVLMIDTAISVMELPSGGNAYIDPLAIRGWLRRSAGAIERYTDAAVALAVHDSKDGKAASGPADWRNFARLVLQLEAGERDGLLTLNTIKGNLGFPYRELTLDRDFRTLTATFTTGTQMGRGQTGSVPRTADEITAVLTDLYNQHVRLLTPDRRLKESVEAILVPLAGDLHIARPKVRDFIRSAIRFEDRPGRGNSKVAVGLHSDPRQTDVHVDFPPRFAAISRHSDRRRLLDLFPPTPLTGSSEGN
jgi:hypothetical protein